MSEERLTIFIRYNPIVTFPSVEDVQSYMEHCEKCVRNAIKSLDEDPSRINDAIIHVPDAISAIYIELYAKCLNCNVAFLKRFGDAVERDNFYRPFVRLMRESELYREQMEEWLKGEADNPLIDTEE